jgi:4-amino-4-deoxy-L-arabinose transferase-like glycosyltransferase
MEVESAVSASTQPRSDSTGTARRLLIVHTVLITLIVVGTVMRMGFPFIYNPLESLFSDNERHYHNAFDVHGNDLESILNPPGFEFFLSTLLRITGDNRFLISSAMALLSAVMPWFWYRWLREMTRDKTISLLGYTIITFLPSYFRIFGYFMDSVILLPLTGAALWLTWRAARKGTWRACMLAAVVCGGACCTKSVALSVVVLPWLYVGYKLWRRMPKQQAVKMVIASVAIVGCLYGLGPLKVLTHTGCFVLLPDGIYNQRYFESGAHDIEVDSAYRRFGDGDFVQVSIWGSSSVCYPPFYPFSNWMCSRTGRYSMVVDYKNGRDYTKPINMKLSDRIKYTFENIIFFFFEYQWPEDNDWQDPFPRNILTMVRFIWFPLTIIVFATIAWKRKREFMPWYFVAVTLIFMFQQTAVMEGRYKKLWEGVAIAAALNVLAGTRFYRRWRDGSQDDPNCILVATDAALPEAAPRAN